MMAATPRMDILSILGNNFESSIVTSISVAYFLAKTPDHHGILEMIKQAVVVTLYLVHATPRHSHES